MAEKKEFKKRPEWIPTDEVQDVRQRAICQRLDKALDVLERILQKLEERSIG